MIKYYLIKKGDFIIVERVIIADRFFQRLMGLLRQKNMAPGNGLLIRPCKQVHTFGMHFDIDVVFLTNQMQVVKIEQNMKPGKMSKYVKEAACVLELTAGSASTHNLRPLDYLCMEPCISVP